MAKYAKDLPSGSTNYIKNVAVVGAGGQAGKYIVEALLSEGKHTVTAITRSGSSSTFAKGIKSVPIDYNDTASIVSALKGQDALIITMAVTAPPDTQAKLIAAAAEAGVPWVLPNEWGADEGDEAFIRESIVGAPKQKTRASIEATGVSSWIGIACGFWYEYSLAAGHWSYGFNFADKKVLFYGDGKTTLPTSTWQQTGMAAARVLGLKVLPDDENDKSLTVSHYKNAFARIQSFNVNQQDMLDSVLRVTGDKASDWTIENVDVKAYWKENFDKLFSTGDRMRYFGPTLYSRSFFPGANYANERGLDNEKLGLPKEDFDQSTKVALKMVEEQYFQKIMGARSSSE